MKVFLAWLGALSLLAWTAGGTVCWLLTREHVTVVLEPGERTRALPDDPLAPIVARLEELAQGQSALALVVEQNLGLLDERAEERARDTLGSLETGLSDLRSELATAGRALASSEPAAALAAVTSEEIARVGATEEAPLAPPAAAPEARSSFLAFQLPADDFRPDERRSWTILPDRSRAGFDAKSTLHDFSGASTAVSGSIAFEPAHPELMPGGEIHVAAGSLDTDNDARDETMREHLDVVHHAEIVFLLKSFEPSEVDLTQGRVRGTARGTLAVRGVKRPFAMPVTATLDAGRQLSLEGEAALSLSDFGVPVPSKLGLISMEEKVVVWIALRARLDGRESS